MSEQMKVEIKQHLETSRAELLEAVEGLQPDQLSVQVQSDGEQWTVLQMMRHLQDAHVGLVGQAKRLQAGGITVPRDFDIDRWNARAQRKTAESDLSLESCLATLETSHQELIAFIETLGPDDFGKMGWSAFLEKELSLEDFLKLLGSHEALHAKEIAAALG